MHGFTSREKGYEHAQALAGHTGRTLHVGAGGSHLGRLTATQFGEVTEILEPEFALDYAVGTPATMVAEYDTDDFVDLVEFGKICQGPFCGRAAPDTRCVAHHHRRLTYVDRDRRHPSRPRFLLFDADGDLLGAEFVGFNSDGDHFATFVRVDLDNHHPPGTFLSGSSEADVAGAIGLFDVPGWDGNFPVPARWPSPARSRCSAWACSVSA